MVFYYESPYPVWARMNDEVYTGYDNTWDYDSATSLCKYTRRAMYIDNLKILFERDMHDEV